MSLDFSLLSAHEEDKWCPHCGSNYKEREELFESNITHNLGKMASEAGIYEHLWRPEEIGITTAQELIEPLSEGLWRLKSKPEHFEKFNSSNGWGLYKNFVPFVEEVLKACRQYPNALVRASR